MGRIAARGRARRAAAHPPRRRYRIGITAATAAAHPARHRDRLKTTAALATAAIAALASAATAASPPTPWNGSNPFNCTIQDAGFGATGPDPGADPYCVRFDKTRQNVSQLGVADFLLKEPARTAAALPKCFYFQEDHWRGSLVQSDGGTVIYEFQGHYFFNKATGDGGAWVTGFTLAGHTFDPTQMPGFPPGYGQYFGPGTGGFITHNDIPTDPQCVAKAQANPASVYARSRSRCVPDSGWVNAHGLGPIALGTREDRIRAELGPPGSVKRGYLRYCVGGGGAFKVGERGDRSGSFGADGNSPAVILISNGRGFVLQARRHREVSAGSRARALHRAFPHAGPVGRVNGATLFGVSPDIVAAVAHHRVRYLAVYDRHAIRTPRRLEAYLRRSG